MQPAEYVTDATTRFLALSLLGFWLGAAIWDLSSSRARDNAPRQLPAGLWPGLSCPNRRCILYWLQTRRAQAHEARRPSPQMAPLGLRLSLRADDLVGRNPAEEPR